MKSMKSPKREHQQPSIKCLKKEYGKAEWILGLFLLQFIAVIVIFELQLIRYRALAEYLEDALAAGGLASALIDVERYGEDNILEISDPYTAYEIYKSSLSDNIGSVVEAVEIEEYLIYNVEEGEIEVIRVDDTGITDRYSGSLGIVTAPNGQIIQTTGVYSEISFPVEGIFGITTRAQKGKLIEININKTEDSDEEY